MFVKYGKEYAAICRRRGNEEEAVYAEKEVEKVYQAVLDAGWDGEWFLRAYDAAGEKSAPMSVRKVRSTSSRRASVFLLKSVSKKDWQKKP